MGDTVKKTDGEREDKKGDFFERIVHNKKFVAGLVTLILFSYIVYSSLPFLSAFFGAAFLAYIFNPFNKRLRRRFSPAVSAWIILSIALIVFIIPMVFIINGLINQVYLIAENIDKIDALNQQINRFLPGAEINLSVLSNQLVSMLTNSIRPLLLSIINYLFVLFLIFFFLYYFLLYSDKIYDAVNHNLPFKEKTNKEIITKFKQITDSTIIGTFFIALVQGGLLAINFYFLSVPNALFWGFVTAIFSFIPFTGAPLIWGPAVLYFIVKNELNKVVAMFIIGIAISTIDNVIRPLINQRYGSIHPLISIVGIVIGLYQFGFIGIFIGPLLVVYMILFWRIYREEIV